MIEHTEVSGRPATVAYLTTDWQPVAPPDADIAKVMFDDGDVVFLRLRTNIIRDYDPDEPRDPQGQWTAGGRTESGDVIAFHGTTADVAQKILKEGIKIGGGERSFAVRHKSLYSAERGQSVYVADDMSDALRFAQFRSINIGRQHQGSVRLGAVVFEVHIPPEAWRKFKEDEQNEFAAHRAEFNIPPAWIAKATAYEPDDLFGTGRELKKDAAVVVKFLTVLVRHEA